MEECLKVAPLHGCFSRFSNCAHGTKPRNAPHKSITIFQTKKQNLWKENSPFSCNKRKTKQHWSKKQTSERLFGTYKNFPGKLTFQPLICKCSYPYQVTRNVSFSEDFAYIQIRSCLTFLVELFPSFFYFLDIQIKILQQIYH